MLSCLSSKSKISFLHLYLGIKSFSVSCAVGKDVSNLEMFREIGKFCSKVVIFFRIGNSCDSVKLPIGPR